jgi:multidrug resistance efflux pump
MNLKKSKLLFQWLYKEKSVISKIYILAILQGGLYLGIPLGIQGVVTYIMAGSFSASLILLSCVTIIITIFIGFFQIWQMRINETLNQKIFGNLASKISLYLNQTSSGSIDVFSKLNKYFEVVTLQKGVSKILLDVSFSVISIIFGLLILPVYSSWFLYFTLGLGFSFYYIINHYGKKGIETNISTSNEKYKLVQWFQENVKNDRANSTDFIDKTDVILGHYIDERKKHYEVLESQFKGIIIFKIVFVSILLFLGAYLVQIGSLNIGQFIASEIIIFLVINSVEKLVSSLGTCYDMITAIYKLESVFDNSENISIVNNHTYSLSSMKNIYYHPYSKVIKYSIYLIGLVAFIILFMPWTQNVESYGKVTTLNPENRPQTITSRIGGRIEKWFIHEGDYVNKNDTIAFISEIKDEYIDPLLINRSENQIKAKETTLESYEQKINAVNSQIDAINKTLRLKIEQSQNKILQTKMKIKTDSMEAQTSNSNYKVAEEQFKRYEELLIKGIISKTDVENRKVKLQDALAKKTSAENKYLASKNEFLNAEIELNSIQQEYQEKLMKAESDKFSALSALYEGEGSLNKLQNQLANYTMRKGFYYVLAPQDGYITKTYVQGIGEIIKEGASMCAIVPDQTEQAIEMFVNPIDFPLIQKGQTIQLIFDGWPAFVFSGWPGVSYGTFNAEVVAFDKVISDNGKFRLLAKNKGKKWPTGIQIGCGVKGFALLNNVPLIYELWRKINGFPPEFYIQKSTKKQDEKK